MTDLVFRRLFLLVIYLFLNIAIGEALKAQKNIAFPGAEGFGMYSLGGRGGNIIKVTNLNDSGPGSLREAIDTEGPRIIVFKVAGIIDLETTILINNPYITIAGHTAPSQGITIRGNFLLINSHNVIIRFLRIRPGDINFGPKNFWDELDAIGIYDDKGETYNIIIDHCSFTWAVDEVIGIWGNPRNITIQNSIIGEGLHWSKHSKGPHSRGVLVGSLADSISILNNLIIHNAERNPQFSNSGVVDIRNNIIYNPKDFGAMFANWRVKEHKINFVGNIFIAGPDTRFKNEISIYDPRKYNGKIFLDKNIGFNDETTQDNRKMLENWHTRESLEEGIISSVVSDIEFINKVSYTKTSEELIDYTNRYIGASLPVRDNVDRRLIYELNNRSGKIINSQNEVGGWPGLESGFINLTYDSSEKYEPTDESGIPIEWLEKYNIIQGDENMDFNGNGYTNIEEYLNGTDPRSYLEPDPLAVFRNFSLFYDREIKNLHIKSAPNPFNNYAKIWFYLPELGKVRINMFDSAGKMVDQLVNSELYEGAYEFIWVPSGLNRGIYLATLNFNGRNIGSKILYFYY